MKKIITIIITSLLLQSHSSVINSAGQCVTNFQGKSFSICSTKIDSFGIDPLFPQWSANILYAGNVIKARMDTNQNRDMRAMSDSMQTIRGVVSTKMSIPSGTNTDYLDGTGSVQTFPSVYTQSQINSLLGNYYLASNPSNYISSINSSMVTAALGYTPYNNTNPNGYISSVPAQSWSSITGKPTTLGGYGITDAYPLSGNPSGFITSVPAQSFASLTGKPTTVSGYGITDAVTNVTQGYGIIVTGSGSKTVSVDTSGIMTEAKANNAVGSINNDLNGKVPNSRTITINGVTKPLSADATFTVTATPAVITSTGTGDATWSTSGTNTLTNNVVLASTGVSANTYGSATAIPVITVDVKGRATAITTASVTLYQPTPNNVTRTLNSNYTISTTKGAWVTYSVDAAVTIALAARSATLTPQYSVNGGSTWVSLPAMGFTPPLLSVGLVATQTLQCSGYIPANALVRLNTTTVTGVNYTYNSGQETY